MKIFTVFIFLSAVSLSQTVNPPIIPFPGVPTGSCGAQQGAVNSSNGDFYSCNSGSWNKVGPGAGGLADPGSNGPMKRTSLNVTSPALSADIIGLWIGGGVCSATTFLRGDGQCSTPAGGSPGGSNTQIQINNAGVFGAISNVAAGSVLASQGASTLPIFQTTLTFDARNLGVDCTGTNDMASLLQTFVSAMQPNTVIMFPASCIVKINSQINVPSTSGFTLISAHVRGQNGSGNGQKPEFLWNGTTGGMWNFIANQAPHVEGFAFANGGSNHLDFFLQFDGNPSTYIGTEAWVKGNTFTNNMASPGTFDAVKINTVSGQNHEKNVITDNDFFCSQSRALKESDSTQLTSGSPAVVCGASNCSYVADATPGKRIRVSYASGIIDTTVLSVADNNHLTMNANATSNQTLARMSLGEAFGNGITIGSVNAKHNQIDRNSFTQCARGLNVTNGSFSAAHLGGSANDVLAYINDIAESSELAYLEDENSLRDVYFGVSTDAPLTLSHMRNSEGIAGEYDGFIYFAGGGRVTITGSVVQDTPGTNQVLIGAANPGAMFVNSIGNQWGPGVMTLANLGFSAWRTTAEAGSSSSSFLISSGDSNISDAPGAAFQFGDGGVLASGTNEGVTYVGSDHFGNFPSYSTVTAEPNVLVNTFVNEAKGFTTKFNGFNNSSSMTFIGFDTTWKQQQNNGGSSVGFRYVVPPIAGGTTAAPFGRGIWCKAPAAATVVTTESCIYMDDHSGLGIVNTYLINNVGAGNILHTAGPVEIGGNATGKRFNVDNATTITSGAFTLGASWGSTASIAITVATSKDPAYVVTITTGGSGIAANPTLQITFADGTWTNVPVCHQIQTGGNDIFGDTTVTSRSATSYTYQWAGTPTTGKTYEFTQTCTGT
jgi:hypothetical protein